MTGEKWIIGIVLFACMQGPNLFGSECNTCHAAKGVHERTPDIAPIRMLVDGKERSITPADAFRFHGHSCPGVTTTFRALHYGLQLLYGDEIPETEDLVIFSKTPTSGSLDLLDLVMIGEAREKKTVAPKGMQAGRENFQYILYRKSTNTAVDIRLKPGLFPEDFFEYKKIQSTRKLTPEEWETLHGYMKNIIVTFPAKSSESLFGNPKPYRMIPWGSLQPVPAH
ncbi:MAG: hypothetical protein JXR49_20465 [Acidobacteria bacterium]|nr:hypothetical protein [Acidobacteriota bacterium]